MVEQPHKLTFSERHFLGIECEKWMKENKVANTPESAFAFLSITYDVVKRESPKSIKDD